MFNAYLKKKNKIGIIAEINQCLALLKLKACRRGKKEKLF